MTDDEKNNRTVNDRYMFDGFLIKEFLDSVREGNSTKIQNYIEKYSLDVKYIKDNNNGHNALFYAILIKDDNMYIIK